MAARAGGGEAPATGRRHTPAMATSWSSLQAAVDDIVGDWRAERAERLARRSLDAADFRRLADAGFLLTAVPDDAGGLWRSTAESTRPLCDVLRALATADPSVALVASMHSTVLAIWLAPVADPPAAWVEQRAAVGASAVAGHQWGTITSEPGSGGDILRTRARARPVEDDPGARGEASDRLPGRPYRVSGDKHFGSGSGVTAFMITTAVPDGEDAPTLFVLDVRDRPWDGRAGLRLTAEWDGTGMAATQSHGMRLEDCPATRLAWAGRLDELMPAVAPVMAVAFTAVVLGVLDEAIATAREQLRPRADSLRAYEQVEWSRAEMEHWLAVQAYEGGLRAIESGELAVALHATLRTKEAVAELAESSLLRLTRVLGGGTFSRRSPFAAWFEDVRALGFLRPPWGLAYDSLLRTSFT
jgi:alkylation response protein AidB-like acyl-CoA dehydrogenase